jgi:putative aldouronate transport system permease protein
MAYRTSIIVTILGTLVSVSVTAMYAYVLSVPGFKHGNKFAFFAYFTMLFSGGMLPWYILCTRYYHLTNTVAGLIVPYGMNVFNMFLMRNYLRTIPDSIYESARIDGANNISIFFRIVLPLSQVGLVTIALFYGLSYWNDFYLPLMLITKDNLDTVQYMLYRMMGNLQYLVTNANNSMTQYIQPPLLTARMAMSVLAIGPIIFLYPFVQKYFVKGIIIGAVKG